MSTLYQIEKVCEYLSRCLLVVVQSIDGKRRRDKKVQIQPYKNLLQFVILTRWHVVWREIASPTGRKT